MHLTCPKCGSERIIYAGTSTLGFGGYRSTDARYTCKDCSYTGPLVVDIDKEGDRDFGEKYGENRKLKLPIFWVLILGLISLLAISFGENILVAISFFIIFSFILGLFFYFVKEDEFEPVEKDLENLDDEGRRKED